jgi:hypothetical protein
MVSSTESVCTLSVYPERRARASTPRRRVETGLRWTYGRTRRKPRLQRDPSRFGFRRPGLEAAVGDHGVGIAAFPQVSPHELRPTRCSRSTCGHKTGSGRRGEFAPARPTRWVPKVGNQHAWPRAVRVLMATRELPARRTNMKRSVRRSPVGVVFASGLVVVLGRDAGISGRIWARGSRHFQTDPGIFEGVAHEQRTV